MNKFLPAIQALYLDETTFFYFALTMHLVIVAGALAVQDIRTIFDFVAAFCVTFILFLFPAVIFLLMLDKHGRTRHRNSAEFMFYKVVAYVLILLGFITFSLEMRANIQNL